MLRCEPKASLEARHGNTPPPSTPHSPRAICAPMSDDPFSDPNRPISDADRRKRLRFRAWRRGFKEADLIMGRFAEAHLDTLAPAELDEFERLLDAPDTEVYGWLCGRAEVPGNFDGPVFRRLKDFRIDDAAAQGDGPSA
jgi:antitoxin CptB